jgi:hypothetical protein
MIRTTLFLSLFLTVALACNAQEFKQRSPKSPMDVARTKIGETYVKVTYCQPAMNDRTIFGELVPFGKVWRTGANEGTEITTTKDIVLGGKELEEGTYTIFTIPEKDKWTVIINKEVNQWGSYNYSEANDLFRIDVPVQAMDEALERFTIRFMKGDDNADAFLVMAWEKTKVAIPVSTED